MAALAYLFPPLSGLIAFGLGRAARVRRHGLQSVVFGALWPALVYVASLAGAAGSRAAFALGALLWLALLISTGLGRDPWWPGTGALGRWAETSLGDEPEVVEEEERSAPA